MSTATEVAPPPAADLTPAPPPGFLGRLRLVQVWHLVLALGSAYVLVNVATGVWKLDSLPRTALAVIGALGIAANIFVIALIQVRRHLARSLSVFVLFAAILGALALLGEALGLYEGLDVFAGAFQNAFWQLVIVGVGFAWWVIARRVQKRMDEDHPAQSSALWAIFRYTKDS